MTIKALPHQQPAIAALTQSKGYLLTDDMGLGKTYTALLAARELNKSTAVICPAGLIANWTSSASAVALPIECYSYTSVAKQIQTTPDILILDESHYIKNPKSQRAKFCVDLAKLVRNKGGYVWLLTGTPMTRDVDDYYSQLLAIDAVPYGRSTGKPWSLTGWKKAVMNQVPDRYTYSGYKYVGLKEGGKERLDKMLADKSMGRKKEEVLTLPDKMRSYISIEVKAPKYADDGTPLERLEQNPHFMAARKELANRKAKVIAKLLQQEIKEETTTPDNPVLIFSAHVEAATLIAEKLGCGLITGATSLQERERLVQQFQRGEVPALVGTIGAAGTGLTLTQSCDVRFVDLDWSPANNRQAEDRVYRIGQSRKVVVTHYITDNDIESNIRAIVKIKEQLEKEVAA